MRRLLWTIAALPLMLVGCAATNSRLITKANDIASLAGAVPSSPNQLEWRVITSGVDPKNSTMYTLYGNDVAVDFARTHLSPNYPEGSVLSLVVWREREDARWFGAQIPGQPVSIEFVTVVPRADDYSLRSYRGYEGSPLREIKYLEKQADRRTRYLSSLRAAVMP
jgi:hypothetical protein